MEALLAAEDFHTVITTISGTTSVFKMPSMATRAPVSPTGQVLQAPPGEFEPLDRFRYSSGTRAGSS